MTYEEVCNLVQKASDEELFAYFKEFQITMEKEELVEMLKKNFNELSVGDTLFQTYQLKGKEFKYPTYMVDELVLEVCRREKFPFLHYGLWVEAYQQQLPKSITTYEKEVMELINMAKKTHLRSFDAILVQVEDGSLAYEAILGYLDTVYQSNASESDMKRCVQLYDEFMFQFQQINEVMEEELMSSALPLLARVQPKKAEQLVQQAIRMYDHKVDWVLHYIESIPKSSHIHVSKWVEKVLRQEKWSSEDRKAVESSKRKLRAS